MPPARFHFGAIRWGRSSFLVAWCCVEQTLPADRVRSLEISGGGLDTNQGKGRSEQFLRPASPDETPGHEKPETAS